MMQADNSPFSMLAKGDGMIGDQMITSARRGRTPLGGLNASLTADVLCDFLTSFLLTGAGSGL